MSARADRLEENDDASTLRIAAHASLVRIDRRGWLFLGVLLLELVAATSLRLHGASIDAWRSVIQDRDSQPGVVWGKPKAVRVDEWGTITPAILSQAAQRPSFPEVNPAWGAAKTPLLMNVPVRHFGTLFRPQFWGFFVLDLGRAFAFYWNMKLCLLGAGLFLLLMLVTNNDFWTSVLGTGWVYFSGFTQWWYSSPAMLPEMIGFFALFIVAAHTLILSPKKGVIVAASIAMAVTAINFALCFYPPFQLLLAYLGAAILIGTLGPHLRSGSLRAAARVRIVAAAGSAAMIGIVLGFYFLDARETIALMRNTVYPGARLFAGGDFSLARIFGGFYGFFMSEIRFPTRWENVCEASSFALLFPAPLMVLVRRTAIGRATSALEWSLLCYVAGLFAWMAIGWPRPLAALSGLEIVGGARAGLGIGLASILWCCASLSGTSGERDSFSTRQAVVWAGVLAALAWLFGLHFNRTTNRFLEPHEISLAALLIGAACWGLFARNRIAFAASVLVPSCLCFGLINPVAIGLGPFLETALYRRVARIVAEDPDARWIVYGQDLVADFVKAAGARVFNGTLIVPPLADLRVLDPRLEAVQVYNRYAHVMLHPQRSPTAKFVSNPAPDAYGIGIAPKSADWQRLGIRYVVLRSQPVDPEFLAAVSLVATIPENGIWIYRYAWNSVEVGE